MAGDELVCLANTSASIKSLGRNCFEFGSHGLGLGNRDGDLLNPGFLFTGWAKILSLSVLGAQT